MDQSHDIQLPEDQKTLVFRDRRTLVTRVVMVIAIIIFVLATTIVTFALRGGLQKQDELTQLLGLAEAQGGDLAVARQIYDAIQKINKLTQLPEDEVPIFATVADVEKLRTQPMFQDAVNGDYILYYAKAQWMYIYRLSENRLITQGPFVLPAQDAVPPENNQEQPPIQPSIEQTSPPDVPVPSDTPEAPPASVAPASTEEVPPEVPQP